jgi:sporulation protein YlmC with PRC-barrel domain
MNRSNIQILVTWIVVLSVCAVQAQVSPQINPLTQATYLSFRGAGEEPAAMRRASRLIGSDVRNYQGDKIGLVDDIALDRQSGKISYLVLATGGIMGMGETRIAAPLQVFHTDISGQTLLIDLSKDELKNAPQLSRDWPADTDQELREANSFFAQTAANSIQWLQKEPEAGDDRMPQAEPMQSDQPKLTADQERWTRRTSNLVGIDVRDSQNRTIGELTDLVFDMGTGQVAFGLIEIRNIADIKNQLAACPWSSVSVLPQEKVAKVDAGDSTLRAVAFRRESMPDLSNRDYVSTVYEQFNQKPYWTTYGYEGEDRQMEQEIPPQRIFNDSMMLY